MTKTIQITTTAPRHEVLSMLVDATGVMGVVTPNTESSPVLVARIDLRQEEYADVLSAHIEDHLSSKWKDQKTLVAVI